MTPYVANAGSMIPWNIFSTNVPVSIIFGTKYFGDLHISNENNVKNVIFGIEESRHAINLIILLVKQYIIQNKQLDDQVKPSYEGARAMVEHHVRVEKHSALVNGTLQAFTDKWEGIMQCDLLAGIYRETSGAAR